MMLTRESLHSFLQTGSIVSTGPQTVLLGWGPRTLSSHPPSTPQPAFYFPDYFLADPQPWSTHLNTLELEIDHLIDLLSPAPPCASLPWNCPDKSSFTFAVEQLLELIASQKLTKAVPYAFATSPGTHTPERLHRSLHRALLYIRDHPGHLYGSWHASEGILGVTPELLFTLARHSTEWHLKTAALAGTAPKADALSHPKLIHEHQVVVDGICQSLAPFGSPTIGLSQTLQLPYLAHLKTPIEMKVYEKISTEQLVRALHPTPALGAFPRLPGESWLRGYDKQFPRLRFGAPVGYFLPQSENSHCYVAIRNVQWHADKLFISAGCGVVADSTAEEEWNEIQLKIQAIKDLLAL